MTEKIKDARHEKAATEKLFEDAAPIVPEVSTPEKVEAPPAAAAAEAAKVPEPEVPPAETPKTLSDELTEKEGVKTQASLKEQLEKKMLTPAAAMEQLIKESRKALKHPIPAGQRLFESPEGIIKLGEKKDAHLWCKETNGGKGGWINPVRVGRLDLPVNQRRGAEGEKK